MKMIITNSSNLLIRSTETDSVYYTLNAGTEQNPREGAFIRPSDLGEWSHALQEWGTIILHDSKKDAMIHIKDRKGHSFIYNAGDTEPFQAWDTAFRRELVDLADALAFCEREEAQDAAKYTERESLLAWASEQPRAAVLDLLVRRPDGEPGEFDTKKIKGVVTLGFDPQSQSSEAVAFMGDDGNNRVLFLQEGFSAFHRSFNTGYGRLTFPA